MGLNLLQRAACGVFLTAAALSAQAQQTLDATAAIVNNDIILESELNSAQQAVAKNLAQNGALGDNLSARKAALEDLITKSIILQLAQRNGISINDLQLDDAINAAAARNGATPAQVLSSMGSGLSEAQQRQAFKENMIISEVRRAQVRRRINVSEAEVKLLAKNLKNMGSVEPRYHLAQIIVPLSANAPASRVEAAAADVNQIKAQLKQGANFSEMAARYTQGVLAAQGGDLGYMPESQVPVPFIPALLKAAPGDVIGPFRSPFGLHLLKVIDISHDAVQPVKMYDAAHILLSTSIVFSDEAARNQLAALRQQIVDGEISFAAAAKKYSEDTASAVNGGDLGFAAPDRYDPSFARAMVSLKPGQISEPIRSSFGWHLIQLKNVKIDDNSDAAYEDKARSLIMQRQFKEQALAWEREMRDSAYVQVLDPQLVGANLTGNNK